MKSSFTVFLFFMFCSTSFSSGYGAEPDSLRKDALNVFMNASDYIKREIPYVNYVRDLKDAGVYIISTSQNTGSGGREYSYFFVGQHEYKGMNDTITVATNPDATEDEIRSDQVNALKIGLARYVAKTPLWKYMKITFTEPISETVSTDKWNSWVFRARVNGFFDGEQSIKSKNLNGNFSANRVTENWKIDLRARYNYRHDKFDIDDELIESSNNSQSFDALVVRSISDHWSYGGSLELESSSYNNLKFATELMPGIEYDIFPYRESTRRQLRLLYSIGYRFSAYNDSTIYDRIREGHFRQSIEAAYEVVQKWGSIDLNLEYSNYLNDWSKNNLSIDGYVDVRLAKGLSVNFGGGASLIHDQLGLVKGGATQEEVLLRRKELATQFQYFTSFGFTFTFGSIYNNVVNPRFGNGGGGGMIIMY
ncbi:MAG: DUF481 domain-containing protein [Bacteroidales bacterium]|nr:DUF481 domain-containing protein [Bacteroidales bacterium]